MGIGDWGLMKIGFVRMTREELSELCKSDTKDSRLFFKNYINTLSKIYDADIELLTYGKNCDLYENGQEQIEIETNNFYANDFCYYIDIGLQNTKLEGKVCKEPKNSKRKQCKKPLNKYTKNNKK